MWNDLRFTVRALCRSPWYALTAIGVMATTLALASTVFAVVDGVMFRPLPYPEASRLVSVLPGFRDSPAPESGRVHAPVSEVDLANWHRAVPEAQFTAFSAQRAAESGPGIGLNEDTAGVAHVQPNFFDVIGVRPLFGGFSPEDFAQRAQHLPVVLMYDTWQSRYAGDPDVLGRVEILIRARDFGFRIVGVMPEGFTFPSARVAVDFLTPFVRSSPMDPRTRGLNEVVSRLPEGMQPETLAERVVPGLQETAALYSSFGGARLGRDPATEKPYDVIRVSPLSASLARRSKSLFLGVVLAVVLLMLVAAANVSSLMAARALERRRELDVRRSLGASRLAIVRLWATESVVLLATGTLLGLLAAAPLLNLIVSLLPETVVLLKSPRLDWRVAAFVALATSVLSVMVAVMPVRRSLRMPAGGPVKDGSSARARTAGRFAVIGGQVGAAYVLTVVGACLVGSLLVVYGKPLSIRTEGVVVLEVRLHGPGGGRTPADVAERLARGRRIRERLGEIPGVGAVGLVEAEVLRGDRTYDLFSRPEGVGRLSGLDSWGVTGEFYDVVEPVVVAGRLPTNAELEAGEPVIVVSERVARAYWPDAAALGQSLSDSRNKVPHTVIGVVRDVRWHGWDLESPIIYGPYSQLTRAPFLTFFARTDGQTGRVIHEAARSIVEADPTIRVRTAATLDEMYRESVALRRFQSWLFGGFAAAALAVVGSGIFGLLAMATARRTREIGVRCALGATANGITVLLLREQIPVVVLGLLSGGIVSVWAVGFVEAYLYELTVADPRIWASATAVVLLTALAGALIPAWRASRTDPLKALRVE